MSGNAHRNLKLLGTRGQHTNFVTNILVECRQPWGAKHIKSPWAIQPAASYASCTGKPLSFLTVLITNGERLLGRRWRANTIKYVYLYIISDIIKHFFCIISGNDCLVFIRMGESGPSNSELAWTISRMETKTGRARQNHIWLAYLPQELGKKIEKKKHIPPHLLTSIMVSL